MRSDIFPLASAGDSAGEFLLRPVGFEPYFVCFFVCFVFIFTIYLLYHYSHILYIQDIPVILFDGLALSYMREKLYTRA